MITRRATLVPFAAALAADILPGGRQAAAGITSVAHASSARPALPERYDEPLGIGLETWPYPAPVRLYNCTADGQSLRMAYMDVAPTGPNKNRTVVLLHGKNFDSSYWARPMRDLAAAGFRVIVPDQIGFHKSSKPDLTYTLDLLANLTINLLAGQQIGRFSMIGHSTGGLIAIRIAATQPDKVDRLVLESPLGLVDYHRYIPAQSLDTLVSAEQRRTLSAQRAFMRAFFPVLPAAEVEKFVECRMRVSLSSEYDRFCKAAALTYEMIYREPVRDQIDDIAAPTLMVVGEKDTTSPLRHYAAPVMASKIPNVAAAAIAASKDLRKGTLLAIPSVGHVPHLEAPDQFQTAVTRFLTA